MNRYIDLLLSLQPPDFQREFVDALAFIDSESQSIWEDFRHSPLTTRCGAHAMGISCDTQPLDGAK